MKTQDKARLIDLGRALAQWTTPDILAAMRCAARLHRADEMQCNGDAWQDGSGQWVDCNGKPCRNPYGRALATMQAIVARYPGWVWYHQTDPRGRSVYLISPECGAWITGRGFTVDQGYHSGVAL